MPEVQQIFNCYGLGDPQFVIKNDNQGKPVLKKPQQLHFNVSHSHGILLMALCCYPIGVDLEKIDQHRDIKKLAERILSKDSFIKWSGLNKSDQIKQFFKAWSAMEAIAKNGGSSLFNLGKQSIKLDHQGEPLSFQHHMHLIELNIEGFAAYVCCDKELTQISCS